MEQPQQSTIEQLLTEQRRQKAWRDESLGPIMAAVAMMRESCTTIRIVLDEMESCLGHHLEVLDALQRQRSGNRWWDELTAETASTEEGR